MQKRLRSEQAPSITSFPTHAREWKHLFLVEGTFFGAIPYNWVFDEFHSGSRPQRGENTHTGRWGRKLSSQMEPVDSSSTGSLLALKIDPLEMKVDTGSRRADTLPYLGVDSIDGGW